MFGSHAFGTAAFGSKIPRENALYGIVGNPREQELIVTNYDYVYDHAGWAKGYQHAQQMGSQISVLVINWTLIEPTQGVYQWDIIDRWVDSTTGPLHLAIAVIDSDGAKHVPFDLDALAWTNATLQTAFTTMLTQLETHLDDRLWILAVGNESDLYLDANPGEVANFASFLTAVKPTANTLFGSAPTINGRRFRFTTTFTFPCITAGTWANYAAVHATNDIRSITYYYPGGDIGDHMNSIYTTGGGPFVLQEIGFHSAASLGSSQQLQADIFVTTWDILQYWAFIGVLKHVCWWQVHNFREEVLTDAGLPEPVFTYFANMGFRDEHDHPKLVWPIAVEKFGGSAGLIEAYRFRNDDGSESTATWKAGETVALSLQPGQTARIRVRVDSDGDLASMQPRLDYKKSTDMDWLPVE